MIFASLLLVSLWIWDSSQLGLSWLHCSNIHIETLEQWRNLEMRLGVKDFGRNRATKCWTFEMRIHQDIESILNLRFLTASPVTTSFHFMYAHIVRICSWEVCRPQRGKYRGKQSKHMHLTHAKFPTQICSYFEHRNNLLQICPVLGWLWLRRSRSTHPKYAQFARDRWWTGVPPESRRKLGWQRHRSNYCPKSRGTLSINALYFYSH